MTFGERLYQLRKEKNLSQEDLAERLGISRQSVSRWENGTASPDFEKTAQIAEIFSVSTDYLICGKDAPSAPSAPARLGGQKITGIILLALSGIALLWGLIFGGYFDYYFIAFFPFFSCGLVCFFGKKQVGFSCLWILYFWLSNSLYISYSWYWSYAFWIFKKTDPAFSGYILPGWFLLLALIGVVFATALKFRKGTAENRKKYRLFIGLLPLGYFLLEFLSNIIIRHILTPHLALTQGYLFMIGNILIYTARVALITTFSVALAKWLYIRKHK